MPVRLVPKKRRLVVESSSDEDLSPKSSRRVPRARTPPNHSTTGPPTTTTTTAARSTSSSSLPLAHLSVSASVPAVSSSRPKPKPKPKRTIYPRGKSVPAKEELTLPAPSSSQSGQPTASQHEDLDDLIVDSSSDDDHRGKASTAPTKHASNSGSQTTAREFGARRARGARFGRPPPSRTEESQFTLQRGNGSGNFLELRGLAPTVPPPAVTVAKPQPKIIVTDPRPWPERFAPQASADLAVHPKKVSEVRSWLEHVLDGFSRQRLLILKGSAGAGKTATIRVLSRELGFDIQEWKNPSATTTGTYGEEGAFSPGLAGIFEEFVGRAGRFGSLDMAPTSLSSTAQNSMKKPPASDTGVSKKIILIEDFPNALFTSSQVPLASFRHTIKSFLAIPKPSRSSPPLPPLVLIISESATVTGPGAFTAHRLLSSEILQHPLTASISFNKIAPTFMLKALGVIVTRESRESGRKSSPSTPLMEALISSGDIRSAIMGLEFLAVNGDLGAFSERTTVARKKKKLGDGELNQLERDMLVGVTQRESHTGIFHAIGKVVYNKRYGDDVEDPYMSPPPRPPLETHPWRARASRVDINTLMDEAGTDAQTLISGLHENYLGSCNFLGGLSSRTHTLEDILDCVNACLADLSDSDLLASPRPYHNTLAAAIGGNYDASRDATGTAGIRLDEMSFQVAVRGVMMALPSPAKRGGRDNKMFYPTSLKLWRQKEEIEGIVDLFVRRLRVADDAHVSGPAAGRSEMVLERLPYLKMILREQQRASATRGMQLFDLPGRTVMRELEKVAVLRGIGAQSEDVPDEDGAGTDIDEVEAAEERRKVPMERRKVAVAPKEELVAESLVLVDDDIEDDW